VEVAETDRLDDFAGDEPGGREEDGVKGMVGVGDEEEGLEEVKVGVAVGVSVGVGVVVTLGLAEKTSLITPHCDLNGEESQDWVAFPGIPSPGPGPEEKAM